jgi:hypothetical protein
LVVFVATGEPDSDPEDEGDDEGGEEEGGHDEEEGGHDEEEEDEGEESESSDGELSNAGDLNSLLERANIELGDGIRSGPQPGTITITVLSISNAQNTI